MTTKPKPAAKSETPSKPRAPRKTSSTSKATANEQADAAAKLPTKRDQLAALLVRDEGATIDQMIAATGWLPHTVRAALTGLKKLGYGIDSDKIDGLRTYRAVAPK